MPGAQDFRFDFKPDCLFSGQLIKRQEPICFRLNARKIKAFKGDTILSALLAAGIDSAGKLNDEHIALDPGLFLTVFPAGKAQSPLLALPIERTKVINGMELATPANGFVGSIAQKYPLAGFAARLMGKSRHSLNYNLAERMEPGGAWISLGASERQSVDLVVVGGGVAGMSAAARAAEQGLRVALIEQRAVLGGDAQFFGSTQGEMRSEDFVKELKERIEQKGVLVFTDSVALALSPGKVRVHQVEEKNGLAATRLMDFESAMTIIAAGSFERLPIFSGNRLPGVTGSKTAFHLAANYGVWRGQSAAFCTVSSAATRVALLAADMGIKITKLADGRTDPKSRFFEFAKAYAISLTTGMQVNHVDINKQRDLSVTLSSNQDGSNRQLDTIEAARLVVCGGWQPDLTLWHMAGGAMKWDSTAGQLRDSGTLRNVKLAGACAGAMGMSQCAISGVAAFLDLVGQTHDLEITDNQQFLEHESQDGALPVSRPEAERANCYLDSGISLAIARKNPKPGFLPGLVPGSKEKSSISDLSEEALSLNDVTAKVALKEIDTQAAEVMAQERCGLASALDLEMLRDGQSVFSGEKDLPASPPYPSPPPYLYGRFGAHGKIVELASSEIDNFEVGSLIYPDTKKAGPGEAIGAIFAASNGVSGRGMALINLSQLADPHHAIVRNDTHAIKAVILSLL